MKHITVQVAVSLVLIGCTPTLDHTKVETQLQADISQQQGMTLKSISCPKNVAVAATATFTCTGKLTSLGTFPIAVTQADKGAITWKIPNSKGMLNLDELEANVQEAIASEIGTQTKIDCGGSYRVNKPGDRFDCQVADPITISQGQTNLLLVNITVNVDAQGNVSWQQIRRQQAIARVPNSSASSTTTPPSQRNTTSQAPTAESPQPAVQAAPSGQTADDFLNDPNAADGF